MIKHRYWLLFWAIFSITAVIGLAGIGGDDPMRYIGIAKIMLETHQYLVPHWHGHVYTDKPPLLFWSFVAGWQLFGFNQWWPQLVMMIVSGVSVWLTYSITQALWPERKDMQFLAPFILIGTYFWLWASRMIEVDTLMVLFVLLALRALIMARRGQRAGWWIYVLAVGLAGMTKGPIMFVFTALPALLLPHWQLENDAPKPRRWYWTLLLTTLVGISLTLLWAIPAAIKGGSTYAHAIFIGQIAHRTHFNQQGLRLFYYIKLLPLYLAPWVIYPPLWIGMFRSKRPYSTGTKLCWVIVLFSMLIFALFAEKEPHYIYPQFPFYALLIAAAIAGYVREGGAARFWYQWPFGLALLGIGLVLLIAPEYIGLYGQKAIIRAYLLTEISNYWYFLLIAAGLSLLLIPLRSIFAQVVLLALSMVVLQCFINVAIIPTFRSYYISPQKLINTLTTEIQKGTELAYYGPLYKKPIKHLIAQYHIPQVLKNHLQVWKKNHPHALLMTNDTHIFITHYRKHKPFAWFYTGRTRIMTVWWSNQLTLHKTH